MLLAPDSDILHTGVVELPEVLDLKAATPLTVEFLTLRGRPVHVDASNVQRLGGQCLQVLLSAAMTWKADKIPFALCVRRFQRRARAARRFRHRFHWGG